MLGADTTANDPHRAPADDLGHRSRGQCRRAWSRASPRRRGAGRPCCSRPRCRACSTATVQRAASACRARGATVPCSQPCGRRLPSSGVWVALGLARRGPRRWALGQPLVRDRQRPAPSSPATTRSICSTSNWQAASWRESAAYIPGDQVVTAGDPGRPARACGVLRRAFSRSVRSAWPPRLRHDRNSRGLHRAHRQGALASAPARPRRRGERLRRGRRAGRRTR